MTNLPKLEYVCFQDLPKILGVGRATVFRWRQKKLFKSRRVDGRVIFHLPTVLEACRKHCLLIDPAAYQHLTTPERTA